MTIASLPPSTAVQTITPEQLLAMPDAVDFELVDGLLVERNMGMESSEVITQIIFLLVAFLKGHPLGRSFNNDLGYRCFADRPDKIRKPDVSFIRSERLPADYKSRGYCPVPPDLAIEVVSPGDEAYEVETKVKEYINAGVPIVWVVYPTIKTVRIHRPDSSPLGRVSELNEADTILGEDVLPGFSSPVSSFFA